MTELIASYFPWLKTTYPQKDRELDIKPKEQKYKLFAYYNTKCWKSGIYITRKWPQSNTRMLLNMILSDFKNL